MKHALAFQPDLFGKPPKRRPATPDEQFRLWAIANEPFIQLCLKFALDVKAAGKQHFGIKAIFERVRWEVYIERKEAYEFKVNNNLAPRLARLLVQREPSLGGLFEFRKLKEERCSVKKSAVQ